MRRKRSYGLIVSGIILTLILSAVTVFAEPEGLSVDSAAAAAAEAEALSVDSIGTAAEPEGLSVDSAAATAEDEALSVDSIGIAAEAGSLSVDSIGIAAEAEGLSGNSTGIAAEAEADNEEEMSMLRTGGIPMPWDNDVKMTDEDISFSEIKSRAHGENASLAQTDYTPRVNLPSRFPGNTDKETKEKITAMYPPVRDQANFGTCWDFSTIAPVEFREINKERADKSIDLSELYLGLGIYKTRENPIVGNDAAVSEIVPKVPEDEKASDAFLLDTGGNHLLTGQYLSKGFGFVSENELPYAESAVDANGYKRDPRFDENNNLINIDLDALAEKEIYDLTDLYEVNIHEEKGMKIVKEALIQNGAVGIFFDAQTDGDKYKSYYNESNNAYYCNISGIPNHLVTVVGWNDDFSRSNFNVDPGADGAWLVRNSWNYKDQGDFYDYSNYFWLSYYDKGLKNGAYIFEVTKDVKRYDNNYYYDTQIHNPRWFNGASVANVYKVQKDSNEYLNEVTLEFLEPTDYQIEIYRNLKNSSPISGIKLEESTTKGEFALPGIYTVPLASPALIEKDTSFSVVVSTGKSSVCYESDLELKNVKSKCGLKNGQSFYLKNGEWIDLADDEDWIDGYGNWCISAHTVFTDDTYPPDIEEKVKDASGQEVTLIHNTVYNTYRTKDGKDVLCVSLEGGEAADSQNYQFTGKKITPSKKSFIIYNGVLYTYKKDYKISFKKNKKRGSATAVIKWKKNSAPYRDGARKTTMQFNVVERAVTEDMVSFKVKKGKLKKLTVTADGIKMKPKKNDYSYTTVSGNSFKISFKNNYKGEVIK